MHHPTDKIAHTTAFVTPVVEHWLEQEIAQWVQPMKERSDYPSHHERTLLPRSYISLRILGCHFNSGCVMSCQLGKLLEYAPHLSRLSVYDRTLVNSSNPVSCPAPMAQWLCHRLMSW